jgi:deazaflavin-dependent oxidoreductase (nitroreductase family)
MPLPAALARFNVKVTNRILGPIVVHLPGFGILEHVGRRTGAVHRTPLNAFRHGDRLTVALTYGPRTQWVQNVLASGGATFERGDRRLRLVEPRLYHDERRRNVPWLVRPFLRLLSAADFFEARIA